MFGTATCVLWMYIKKMHINDSEKSFEKQIITSVSQNIH